MWLDEVKGRAADLSGYVPVLLAYIDKLHEGIAIMADDSDDDYCLHGRDITDCKCSGRDCVKCIREWAEEAVK